MRAGFLIGRSCRREHEADHAALAHARASASTNRAIPPRCALITRASPRCSVVATTAPDQRRAQRRPRQHRAFASHRVATQRLECLQIAERGFAVRGRLPCTARNAWRAFRSRGGSCRSTMSLMIDALAIVSAQDSPLKRIALYAVVAIIDIHAQTVAAQRVDAFAGMRVLRQRAEILRIALVPEDDIGIQRIHAASIPARSYSAASSAAMIGGTSPWPRPDARKFRRG